jgi:hypothetical protein
MADEKPEVADVDAVGNAKFIGEDLVRRKALRRPERVTDIVVGSNFEARKLADFATRLFDKSILYNRGNSCKVLKEAKAQNEA